MMTKEEREAWEEEGLEVSKCAVCGDDAVEYNPCFNCGFENDFGLDEAYPDDEMMDHRYTLNEAKAWYKEGRLEEMIEHRQGISLEDYEAGKR